MFRYRKQFKFEILNYIYLTFKLKLQPTFLVKLYEFQNVNKLNTNPIVEMHASKEST